MKRKLYRLGLLLALSASAFTSGPDPTVGQSYRIPYRNTYTNHALVRVRINGKGPFNFLVDTGAPALYIGTEAAKEIGLEPSKVDFWTDVDRLDFEGGASLKKVKARVEDPFQLTGMNALGLPGTRIDGILGFTMLAKYRLEIDPTKDRMVWTRLDYDPKEPDIPRQAAGAKPPAEVQAMELLGPLLKFAAPLIGKQPEDQFHPRGYLGIVLAEAGGEIRVDDVLADSPASKAGLKAGDRLLRLLDRELKSVKDAREAVAGVKAEDKVALRVLRDGQTLDMTLTAGEGL